MGSITDKLLDRLLGMRLWAVAPLTAAITALRTLLASLEEWARDGDPKSLKAARSALDAAQANVAETGGAGLEAVTTLAERMTTAFAIPPPGVDLKALRVECTAAQKVLLGELRAARWPSIWRLAIVFVAALALTRVVSAAAGFQLRCAVPWVCDQLAAELVLQDVRVSDSGTGDDKGVAIIDIIVRNDGDRSAVVHEATFTITGYQFIFASGAIPSSGSHTATFPTTGALPDMSGGEEPLTWPVDIAQSVDAIGDEDVDRFTIRVVPEPGGAAGFHDYRFVLRLTYDSNRSTADSEEFLIRLPYRDE